MSKAYTVYYHITFYLEESINVAFDESSPQKTWKCICSDVSGMMTEKLINDKSFKEDPPLSSKDEDIKKYKEESLHEDDKQEQETSN